MFGADGWDEDWLPAFPLLAENTKDWLLSKGHCGECKEKLSSNEPYCKCSEIIKVEIRDRAYSGYNQEFADIFRYEKRRDNSRYCAVAYKNKKDKAEGKHTQKDIKAIYELQEGRCYYCLTKISYNGRKRNFDADHIKPLAQGGTNWPDNIAAACKACNSQKSDLGGLAFWNRLEKKIGDKAVLQAKQLAKEQRPRKKEISKNRKLEIQKKC